MPKQPKALSRTVQAGAKVTRAEFDAIRLRATAEGLTISEWTRVTVLRALQVDPVTRTMMAEFLAMRRIVLTLYPELRKGNKELSPSAIDRLVADTEYSKYAMADRRIRDTLNLPVEEDPTFQSKSKDEVDKKS